MKKAEKLRPYDARTDKQPLSLKTDNHDSGSFWILIDGLNVFIHEQKVGENYEQGIAIPRSTFNRLISWYMREQKITRLSGYHP